MRNLRKGSDRRPEWWVNAACYQSGHRLDVRRSRSGYVADFGIDRGHHRHTRKAAIIPAFVTGLMTGYFHSRCVHKVRYSHRKTARTKGARRVQKEHESGDL